MPDKALVFVRMSSTENFLAELESDFKAQRIVDNEVWTSIVYPDIYTTRAQAEYLCQVNGVVKSIRLLAPKVRSPKTVTVRRRFLWWEYETRELSTDYCGERGAAEIHEEITNKIKALGLSEKDGYFAKA